MVLAANVTSPLWALGLLFAGLTAVAMLAFPYFAFLLTVLTVPLERIGRLTNDSTAYTFSIMRIMGMICLLSLVIHRFLAKEKIKFSLPMFYYACYAAVGLLSLTYTTDSLGGIRQASAVMGNLLFFFLIPNLVSEPAQARRVLALWLGISTAVGLFTIYGWHKGRSVTDSRFHSTGERSTDERFSVILLDHAEFDLGEQIPRALGTTSHPAVYAINMFLTLPFFAFFFRTGKRRYVRIAALAGAGIIVYNVLLTNTRAAVITMGIAIALIFLTRLIRLSLPVVVVFALTALISLPVMPAALSSRIFDLSNYSSARSATLSARFVYWRVALETIADHPLLGVGLGNQSEIPRRVTLFRLPVNSSVHNEYLNSLMEVGVFGYLFLVVFFVTLYRRSVQAEKIFRSRGDHASAMLLTACRVAFWTALCYAVQVDCFHFPLKGWWLVMGLAMAMFEFSQQAVDRDISNGHAILSATSPRD